MVCRWASVGCAVSTISIDSWLKHLWISGGVTPRALSFKRDLFERPFLGRVVGQAFIMALAPDAVDFFGEIHQLEVEGERADDVRGGGKIQRFDPAEEPFFQIRIEFFPQLKRG